MTEIEAWDDFEYIITEIEASTDLGYKIKKIIPKNTDDQKVIISLAYIASDIAKKYPDFQQKKKEILAQIDACFELWGDC